jgi:hypothetical protein
MTAQTSTPSTETRTLDRHALAVAGLAAKDDSRPVLAMVCVRNGWAYAADGYALGAAEVPSEASDGTFFIPAPLARVAVSRATGKTPDITVAIATEDGKLPRVELTTEGRYQETVTDTCAQDVTFPDFEKLFDGLGKPHVEFAISVPRLKQVLTVMEACGAGLYAGDGVDVRVYGPEQAVEFSGQMPDGRKVRALLMPMTRGAR